MSGLYGDGVSKLAKGSCPEFGCDIIEESYDGVSDVWISGKGSLHLYP
jgi:hypothetical protein